MITDQLISQSDSDDTLVVGKNTIYMADQHIFEMDSANQGIKLIGFDYFIPALPTEIYACEKLIIAHIVDLTNKSKFDFYL